MPDVHQSTVVVLSVTIAPELIQLVLPGITQQPELSACCGDAAVVLLEPSAARPERLQVSIFPERPEPGNSAGPCSVELS
jgi:hypothetical protein